ncbi:hypothetical protein BH11BAC6_BH11BAC6_15960 [soil metagenome]
MNIYHPYEVVTDTHECFHLKESELRERMHFTVSTIIPLLFILLGWFILQQLGRNIPMGWNYLLVAVILFVSVYLFLRPFTTAITLTPLKIIITKKAGTLKIVSIEGNKIREIKLIRGRNTGVSTIELYTISNKKYKLVQNINTEAAFVIQQKLQDMLKFHN